LTAKDVGDIDDKNNLIVQSPRGVNMKVDPVEQVRIQARQKKRELHFKY
jgi:hypothetical protein